MPAPIAFVDLETTGTTAAYDRITEIGIVLVDDHGVTEWSSLVNPGRPIPPMIQSLTGITDAMVRSAPPFAEIAQQVMGLLAGRVFVAHNARFDYGFLRAEFDRVGLTFRPPVVCTVRLSRRLYPQHPRHNMDSLIERHGLQIAAEDRHRALGDARLVWQFWQSIHREFAPEHIQGIADVLSARVELPAHLDPSLPDLLPDAHGVYVLYGESRQPLYVGRAENIRSKVLTHFRAANATAKAQRLAQLVRDVTWHETGGAVGALLHEAQLLARLQPTHNRRPRRKAVLAAPWPYPGPIGIRESSIVHVLHEWSFLGSARTDDELWSLAQNRPEGFDDEVHRILQDRLSLLTLIPLTTDHGTE